MKFFVIADMHSYYDPMIEALREAGFDKNNTQHTLVVCGDAFDRGMHAVEMFEYLDSLERKVLIKGNHDDMLMELMERGYPYSFDKHNGTESTVYQLGFDPSIISFADHCKLAYNRFKPLYDQMVDYFETEKYIFVHSWIPISEEKFGIKSFIEDWRNATEEQWKDARWGNPFELAEGVLKPDKTVIFGHWHTTWPRACWEGKAEFGAEADFSTYYGKGYIGLDAMTAHSGKVNVLVVDDEFLKETNNTINKNVILMHIR